MNTLSPTHTAGPASDLLHHGLLAPRFAYPPTAGFRPALHNDAQRRHMQQLAAAMAEGQLGWQETTCPCGQQAEDAPLAEIDRYGLAMRTVICLHCGTLRFDPYLDDQALESFYGQWYQQLYIRSTDPREYFGRQGAYGARLLAHFQPTLAPGANVLEIGCGAGGALHAFQQAGYRVTGFEYDQRLIEYGRSRGVADLHHGGADVLNGLLHQGRWDVIYLHHVFEHVGRPEQMLSAIRGALAYRGRLLVIVPDVTRIDRFAIPAGDLQTFLHISHKYNFTPSGLAQLAARCGLQLQQRTGPARPHTPWAQMPEIWAEMHRCESVATRDWQPCGRQLLQQLQRIEQRYQRGLCPGQWARSAYRLRTSLAGLRTRVGRMGRSVAA